MADTDKIKKEPTLNDITRTIKTLGAGGIATVAGALFLAYGWVSERMVTKEDMKTAVTEAVRAEVGPLKERITRLEVQYEYDRKREGK